MDSWWHYLNKICILLCLRPTYLWTFQVRWVNSVLLTKTVWTEFLSLGGCFRHSSVCKESACNAGDPGLIPGSGSSPGEGIGYPFQYSWASLVAQLVKNLPAMWETWVWKIPWRRERLPTPVSGVKNSMNYIVHRVAKSQTQLSDFHVHILSLRTKKVLTNSKHNAPKGSISSLN